MGRLRSLSQTIVAHRSPRYGLLKQGNRTITDLICHNSDVVPVLPATRDQWSHDPFGGEYDGKYIWGRGSTDDKSGTIGAL